MSGVFPKKVNLFNIENLDVAKNILVVLPSSPIEISVMIGHTNKQTEITTLYTVVGENINIMKKSSSLYWYYRLLPYIDSRHPTL